MLLWYLVLACLPVSLWHERRRWRLLAPTVTFVASVLVVLAVVEGNAGTLFRHRAMVIPFAVALASPALWGLWCRLRLPRIRSDEG
jgi:hypothetical protein